MSEVFRKNAGIIVFNRDRKVLLCKRNDIANSWQFPQGGIDGSESAKQAAVRELQEETSITKIKHVKTLDYPARYHFPQDVITKMQKRGYNNAGQDMFWSLFYFVGTDSDINLQTEVPEFSEFRWGTLNEALELIVDFKKTAYEVAVKEFSDIIANYPLD